MRVKGRRVLLLIAGALPLLAEDDRTTLQQQAAASVIVDGEPSSSSTEPYNKEKAAALPLHERIEPSSSSSDDDDNDTRSPSASGKIPNLLPLNLLQVESEFFQDHDNGYYARGASHLKQLSSLLLDSDDFEEEDDDDDNELPIKRDKKKPDIPEDDDSESGKDNTATFTYSNTTPTTSQTEMEMNSILLEMEANEEAEAEHDETTTAEMDSGKTNTTPTASDEEQALHSTSSTTTINRKHHGEDEKKAQEDIAASEEQQVDKEEPIFDDDAAQVQKVNVTQDAESNLQTEPADDSSGSSADTSTGNATDDSMTNTTNTSNSSKGGDESLSSEKSVDAAEGQEDNAKEQQEEQVETDKEEELQVDKQAIAEDEEDEDFSISDRVAVDYASKSAGALVLEKSAKFQGTSNLLNGDRDRYAIAPCGEKKFVVLSLSEDIYVKQVKLANYELYSSRVKDIQIQISQTMGNWVDLGIYTATPDSGVQAIDLREPAWGRYLKFKFLSHYGEEFYCTLSQIMVHGSTMVQGFHEHLQETSDEDEEEEEDAEKDDDSTAAAAAAAAAADTTTASNVGAEATGTLSASSATPSIKDAAAATAAVEAASQHSDDSTPDKSSDEQDHVQEEVQKDSGAESAAAEEKNEVASQEAKKDAGAVKAVNGDEDSASLSSKESKATDGPMTSEVSADSEDDAAFDDHDVENDSTGENNDGDFNSRVLRMSSRKDRNTSTALPAASIDLSSTNVFSTIAGRLEPLHLKGMDKLSKMRNPFPNSDHLNGMLSKATDSTKAIRNALTDAAILENFQHWSSDTNRMHGEKSNDAEMFGITSIGPREQTLVEKLTAYIQRNDVNQIKRISSGDDHAAEPDAPAAEESRSEGVVADADSKHPDREASTESHNSEKHTADDRKMEGAESFSDLHDTDMALAALLESLPSIECLKTLDFAAFKAKAMASKKGGHGHSGHAAAGHAAEPIFKMLTDQIKTLQANLAVHDQFSKDAFQCYQRVLLDVVVELQSLKLNHETRLLQLEQDIQETKTVRWVFVVYQLIMGLPNWVALTIATFVTSYISPSVIFKPLSLVENFLDTYFSHYERAILSWTLTVCVAALLAVATIGLCQRILSAAKGRKGPRTTPRSVSPGETPGHAETTEREKCQSPLTKEPQLKPEVDEVPTAPDVDPKDTTCVDCNLVAAEVEVDPCVATPSASQDTPSVANAVSSCHNRLVDDASSFEATPSAIPRYNTTESGMRTPDPTGAGDEDGGPSLQEARKSPPSPSSVATLPSCEKEHKSDDQDGDAEPEMKRSVSVNFTVGDDLGLKSDLAADSNLRRSLSANN